MRLVVFCDYFSSSSCGGSERVATEVSRRWVADGHEVLVVSAIPSKWSEGPGLIHEDGLEVLRVRGRDLTKTVGAQLTLSRGLAAEARRTITSFRPDALVAHSLHFQGTYVARRIAKDLSLPFVLVAHLGGVEALGGRTRLLARLWDTVLSRRAVRSADCMIAVSQAVALHLAELGADASRIHVARNGVDHQQFAVRAPRQSEKGPLRLGFVGRMIANKGPVELVEAVAVARAASADVTLTFIGDGPLRRKTEARASDLEIGDRVFVTGMVQDVPARLADIDVLVRPSFTEGLPLSVLEALSMGLPVLATDVPGNTEVVSRGVNGWIVPPGDVEALAEQIKVLAHDRSLVSAMATGARPSVKDLTWESCARQHMDAVRAAVRHRPLTVGRP